MSEIIFQVLKLTVMLTGFVAGLYVIPWLRAELGTARYERIREEAEKLVLAVQQMYGAKTGAERLEIVTGRLYAYLAEHRIDLTEEQVRELIEAAVKQMKLAEG